MITDIVQHLQERLIDYNKVRETCYFQLPDTRVVDVSVIIPVHGRSQFNKIVSKHFYDAIQYAKEAFKATVSLTFVEHSITPEHKDLCGEWVNYIHMPLGEGKFNKCLAHNIGALFSNESKFLLFHDADIIVPKDFFEKLALNIIGKDIIQAFTERRLIYCDQALTGRIISGQDEITEFNYNRPDVKVGGPGAAGGSIFINRKAFTQIGGYDPEFFTEYSIEDQFFLDKLSITARMGYSDTPPIELFHLWHPISYNQTTKDYDFEVFDGFHASDKKTKDKFIDIKHAHFMQFIKKVEKKNVAIYDTQFEHSGQGSFGAGDLKFEPTYFNWIRDTALNSTVRIITESGFHLVDQFKEPTKILMIIESPLINPDLYKALHNPDVYNKFSYILTFSKELVRINPEKFIWYPFGGCWINEDDRKIYPKKHTISIIASNKTITEGHRLRHKAIEEFRPYIQGVYGNGYQFVKNKLEALLDYRYSIVIENDNCDAMFSEKIIDCFVTGTIPIYWGCPSIGDYFNKRGVLCFNNIHELSKVLPKATDKYYLENMDAVQENFQKSLQYALPEDWIWKNFLEKFYI